MAPAGYRLPIKWKEADKSSRQTAEFRKYQKLLNIHLIYHGLLQDPQESYADLKKRYLDTGIDAAIFNRFERWQARLVVNKALTIDLLGNKKDIVKSIDRSAFLAYCIKADIFASASHILVIGICENLYEIVKLALTRVSDVTLSLNKIELSPLMMAVKCNHKDILSLMLNHIPQPDLTRTIKGKTVLAYVQNCATLDTLFARGAKPTAIDFGALLQWPGQNLLDEQIKILEKIIQTGLDLNQKVGGNKSTLFQQLLIWCTSANNTSLIPCAAQNGAYLNVNDTTIYKGLANPKASILKPSVQALYKALIQENQERICMSPNFFFYCKHILAGCCACKDIHDLNKNHVYG